MARRNPALSISRILVPCLWVWAFWSGALAQEVRAQAEIAVEQEMYGIARELWCPLCAGIRLDACELQACVQMREEIMVLLTEGHDRDFIIRYFEEQYGHQVHGEPPWSGFHRLAWLMPILVFAALGLVIGMRMHRAARSRARGAARRKATAAS